MLLGFIKNELIAIIYWVDVDRERTAMSCRVCLYSLISRFPSAFLRRIYTYMDYGTDRIYVT